MPEPHRDVSRRPRVDPLVAAAEAAAAPEAARIGASRVVVSPQMYGLPTKRRNDVDFPADDSDRPQAMGAAAEQEARSEHGGHAVPRTYAAASRGLAGQVTAPSSSVNRGRAGNTTTEEHTFPWPLPK